MQIIQLTDAQWIKFILFFAPLLRLIEALKTNAGSSSPPFYGLRAAARWSEHQVFAELREFCAQDPDLEHLLIDSTVMRAHPCVPLGHRKNTVTKLWDAAAAVSPPSCI